MTAHLYYNCNGRLQSRHKQYHYYSFPQCVVLMFFLKWVFYPQCDIVSVLERKQLQQLLVATYYQQKNLIPANIKK